MLKAIDIHSFLVKVPGHCYMGFYLGEKKTKPYFIETTMIANWLNRWPNNHPLLTATCHA